jgi:hypothetical protein
MLCSLVLAYVDKILRFFSALTKVVATIVTYIHSTFSRLLELLYLVASATERKPLS